VKSVVEGEGRSMVAVVGVTGTDPLAVEESRECRGVGEFERLPLAPATMPPREGRVTLLRYLLAAQPPPVPDPARCGESADGEF
jgi:hypothetical protein